MNLKRKLTGLITLAEDALKANDMDKYAELEKQIDGMETQVKAQDRLDKAKKAAEPTTPATKATLPLPLPANGDIGEADPDKEAAARNAAHLKSIYIARFGGNVEDHADVLTRDIYNQDYMKAAIEQDEAFQGYLRYGDGAQVRGYDLKCLQKQIYDPTHVMKMLADGLSVAEVKSTMVEGQDELGGYAVPPQRARNVLSRLAGLTAVRGGGALIVNTVSNMLEWLQVTGGNDQYTSGLRGVWGGETASPAETNFTYGLQQIPVQTYTFKVPVSVSLTQDAVNFVPILMKTIAETMAADEDNAYLVGDGAQGPRGIMPNGTPETGIAVLNTGVADDIAIVTTKQLRRQIASQYRRGDTARYIFNSSTGSEIEGWQDGIGRFYFESADAGERLFRTPVLESEGMPDIAAAAYPVIYGDLSGYAIVQRLGLAIVRFMDSNTGINKVEYHVRMRLGGRVVEPYRLAALKCSA